MSIKKNFRSIKKKVTFHVGKVTFITAPRGDIIPKLKFLIPNNLSTFYIYALLGLLLYTSNVIDTLSFIGVNNDGFQCCWSGDILEILPHLGIAIGSLRAFGYNERCLLCYR